VNSNRNIGGGGGQQNGSKRSEERLNLFDLGGHEIRVRVGHEGNKRIKGADPELAILSSAKRGDPKIVPTGGDDGEQRS